MIKKVYTSFLLTQSVITDDLATYEFTTGTPTPSIFATHDIPIEELDFPAIWIDDISPGARFGTQASKGAEVLVQVSVFDNKDRSQKVLNRLAWNLFDVLNRADMDEFLNLEDWFQWGMLADPPAQIEDPDGYPGYRIDCLARILRC